MFSKFLSLDSEKRDRILNASMKEFAQKGYENASTNEIVKEAQIAKGLLFHYFKNKKQLFLFLYDYCMELAINEMYKKIDMDEKDIIIRLRKTTILKLELLNKYPELIKFLQAAYTEKAGDVKSELDAKNAVYYKNNYNRVFENIDVSKFKEGISVERVLNIISWTFEGFSNRELEKAKLMQVDVDYDKAFAEADTYIEIFKKCFYK